MNKNSNYTLPLPYPAKQVTQLPPGFGQPRLAGRSWASRRCPQGMPYDATVYDTTQLTPAQLASAAAPTATTRRSSTWARTWTPSGVPGVRPAAGRADHRGPDQPGRQGHGDPELLPEPGQRLQVHRWTSRTTPLTGVTAMQYLLQHEVGLLPALRRHHGRHGTLDRHPGTRRGGLHPRSVDVGDNSLRGQGARLPLLAGAVLPRRRLAALRTHGEHRQAAISVGHGRIPKYSHQHLGRHHHRRRRRARPRPAHPAPARPRPPTARSTSARPAAAPTTPTQTARRRRRSRSSAGWAGSARSRASCSTGCSEGPDTRSPSGSSCWPCC